MYTRVGLFIFGKFGKRKTSAEYKKKKTQFLANK